MEQTTGKGGGGGYQWRYLRFLLYGSMIISTDRKSAELDSAWMLVCYVCPKDAWSLIH